MVHGIAERSGWMCHLCQHPIDPQEPKGSPWRLAGDHIIPRAHNGSDDGANIAPAHQVCNQIRQTRTLQELPTPELFRRLAELRVEEKLIQQAHDRTTTATTTPSKPDLPAAPRPPRRGEYIGAVNAVFSPWTGKPLAPGTRSYRSPDFTDPDDRPFDEHTGARRPGIEWPRGSGDYALR